MHGGPAGQHVEHADDEVGTVGQSTPSASPPPEQHAECSKTAKQRAESQCRHDERVAGDAPDGQREMHVARSECSVAIDLTGQHHEQEKDDVTGNAAQDGAAQWSNSHDR